jgi:hypothetical protein
VINLLFTLANGDTIMVYDVYPRSQMSAIEIPEGAVSVTVWLGTK